MSLVDPKTLKERGVIEPFEEEGMRSIGYDVAIGGIFVPYDRAEWKESGLKGTSTTPMTEYELPAQGTALIISREKLNVPKDIFGEALPKSKLCEDGLLVLNTGLIDPGFNNYLIATVLNFSQNSISLKQGDRFLRLVFTTVPFNVETAEKLRNFDNRSELVKKYPFYFLNLHETARRISDETVRKLFPPVALWVACLSVALASLVVGYNSWNTANDKKGLEERVKLLEEQSRKNPPIDSPPAQSKGLTSPKIVQPKPKAQPDGSKSKSGL